MTLSKILDAIYADYPEQPDWAVIQTMIYLAPNPIELFTELAKVQYLYSEDYSAFCTYMFNLKE
jgi:hypothetical protein